MNRVSFWTGLHALLHEYDLLKHPFYQAWRNGHLSREDIREYAAEYYHQVASFPVYLREFASTLPDGELKQNVLRTLWQEIGMGGNEDRAHNLLWLDFAVAAGAIPGDVFCREPIPAIKALIATFHKFAKSGESSQALVAFYVYESQVPRVSREKAQSLQSIYGFDAVACTYFTLHTTADIAHSQVWRDQLDQIFRIEPDAVHETLVAAQLAAISLWRALDGINSRRLARSKPQWV